jgi:hypothetical protein
MDGQEQLALVAAGTLEPYEEPPTGIDPGATPVESLTAAQIAQEVLAEMYRIQQEEERQQRIEDLREDEDIYAQRRRDARVRALVGDK